MYPNDKNVVAGQAFEFNVRADSQYSMTEVCFKSNFIVLADDL